MSEVARPTRLGRQRSSRVPVSMDESVDSSDEDGVSSMPRPGSGLCAPTAEKPKAPSQAVVHAALIFGQVINGGGAVVAKMGLPTVNPVFFALLREVLATPILFALAYRVDGPILPAKQDLHLLAFGALALCSNQIGYISGLKMANPVVGSAWQPTQPVFVMVMAVALGWESLSAAKLVGVSCCMFGGCAMTVGGAHDHGGGGISGGRNEVVGNLMFFFNCLMTAVFVLVMRVATRRTPANTALAVVYAVASVIIALFATMTSCSAALRSFFCLDCSGFWQIPTGALFALAYWVLGSSVLAYSCLAFGTKHARDATHCLAYTALQPLSAAVFQTVLIGAGWNRWHPENPLALPSRDQMLGALLVVAGVLLVARDAEAPQPAHPAGQPTWLSSSGEGPLSTGGECESARTHRGRR